MASISSSTAQGPIDANGNSIEDPALAWEQQCRAIWRSPTKRARQPAGRRREKDPVFAARLQELERLLRMGTAASASGSVSTSGSGLGMGPPSGLGANVDAVGAQHGAALEGALRGNKGKSVALDDELEPDGGMAVRERPGDELKKVSEGILLAFKQARPLKEPLPLSLVTSLLYRSWELDGTIPSDHPSLRPGLLPRPSAAVPAAVVLSPSAPTTPAASTSGLDGDAAVAHAFKTEERQPLAPPSPVILQENGAAPPEEGGKIKIDMMKGSRWRVEKDVLSGSDVI